MTTRDLLALIVLVTMSAIIGVIDVLLDINPAGTDGLLTAGLVFTLSWFAYRIGKNGKGKPNGK